MKLIKQFSLAALFFLPTITSANGFSGTGELGFSNNTGNTENTALYAALKLNYAKNNYEFKSLTETNYKSEDGKRTEERYLLDLQNNFFYNEEKSFYSFLGLRLEQNRFEDIELDTTLSAGLGKVLYKSEVAKLSGELGAGYQSTDFKTKNIDSESQVVAIAKINYTHKINEQVGFEQDLTFTNGSERKKYESNSALKVKVATKANLKLSYKVRHNDTPAANTKKTDTQTLITLTYDL